FPLKSIPPSARYTKVWFSVMLAPPLLLNPPWRRNSVVGEAWLPGQASAGAPTLQLVRRAPLPVRVNGPSATMLPPLKVSLALVLTPPAQSMYQLPAGMAVSLENEHGYSDD